MKFNAITRQVLEELTAIAGAANIYADQDTLLQHSQDYTENFSFLPEIVVKPGTAEEISAIMKICNREMIPVTPRGAGTGLSGGALPLFGGLVIAMERFNRIIQIDERNLQATVEPGVINEAFQQAVKEKGLFYPPDPASKGSCFLGGNLAESSGGPKAVKYGVTKDYVLNMEVVLPTGEIIWTGANVLKNATGYNLTQLMVGSEGTLGIITRIVFRLIPFPPHNLLMLVPFPSATKTCEAVSAVFRAGFTPSAMELVERDAFIASINYIKSNFVLVEGAEAFLLIEVDGNDPEVLMKECMAIADVMYAFECGEILFLDTAEAKENMWRIRRVIGEAVKATSIYKEEDTVVPRAELPVLLNGVKEIGQRYGFKSICYGHAGDGNLHVNILKAGMSDDDWNHKINDGIREIFELCKQLGGTISGEHGIGYVQKDFMPVVLNETQLNLMRGIKKLFDPAGILNPGKIFNQ